MANVLTLQNANPHSRGDVIPYDVLVTLSSTYPTGGETIDFSGLPIIKTSRPPVACSVMNNPGSYLAEFVPGTTHKNGKLKFYSAVGTEVSAGAYPGGLSGATVVLRAEFRKLL